MQGSTFASQLLARTGATPPQIVMAHRIAHEISGRGALRGQIEEQFGSVDSDVWTEAINAHDKLVSSLTRSYLKDSGNPDPERMETLALEFGFLAESAPSLGPPKWVSEREERAGRFVGAGFPRPMALRLAILPDLVHAPGIFEVAERSGRSVIEVGRVFFLISQAVQLDDLALLLSMSTTRDPWQRWARQTIEDDLKGVLRRLAERALSEAEDVDSGDDAVDSFLASRAHSLKRVLRLTKSLESDQDLAFFMVVVRQIDALAR
ncbi:MAG: hypothetical protein WD274_01825, partial [Acidimicrobiia bacterium]